MLSKGLTCNIIGNNGRSFAPIARYAINHEFLDHGITSHGHAWFWGMFLTDGHLMSNRCVMWGQKFDRHEALSHLRDIVESTHVIYFKKNGTNPACGLNLYSAYLARAAAELLGCDPSLKSFDLTFPCIDPEFLPSLIRGIFDGDGSIVFNTSNSAVFFMICSASYSFLESIRRAINVHCFGTDSELGYIYSMINGTTYELRYLKQQQVHQLYLWLYQSQNRFMRQKHDRFKMFEKTFILQTIPFKERQELMRHYLEEEAVRSREELERLIRMSRGTVNCPAHFVFRPNFKKFHQCDA